MVEFVIFETKQFNLLPLKIYRASNVVYVFSFLFFYIAKLNEFFAFFWGVFEIA